MIYIAHAGKGQIDMTRQTVRDVESMLTYLTFTLDMRRNGAAGVAGRDPYGYARDVLAAAEPDLRQLGMYEDAERAVNDSERLIQAGRFDEADDLLLRTVREMMEKSGTNKRLRASYSKGGS